jgi:hypothetical protein
MDSSICVVFLRDRRLQRQNQAETEWDTFCREGFPRRLRFPFSFEGNCGFPFLVWLEKKAGEKGYLFYTGYGTGTEGIPDYIMGDSG